MNFIPTAFPPGHTLGAEARLRLDVRWHILCLQFRLPANQTGEIYQALCKRYEEPHRAYHNLSHLSHLFDLMDTYHGLFQEPLAVEWAIWLHDVVYAPAERDNERRSAEWARQMLSAGLPPGLLIRVEQLILSTEGHRPRPEDDADGKLFLDMDLSILAAQPDAYDRYAAAIAQEYLSVYPEPLYSAGRARVLEHFLERGNLFFTDTFAPYQAQARANLERELQTLRSRL